MVSIVTPPMLRREPIVRALAQGCHVLVEKPISVGVAEAQEIVQAATLVDGLGVEETIAVAGKPMRLHTGWKSTYWLVVRCVLLPAV